MMRIEAAIQRDLVSWIRSDVPQIHRIVATLNENNRRCMDMGCEEGITDLLLFRERNQIEEIFYLELKTKTGKLSPAQKDWRATKYKDQLLNTHYAVAYGFQHAKDLILEWMEK